MSAPVRDDQDLGLAPATAKHHPDRWRLHRAGISNVWFYYDNEFDLSAGRLILRGTNGAGKSKALEMLLPFLLDADRRKMDATGAGRVKLEALMTAGAEDQPNRLGYLWLELARRRGGNDTEYLTVGALLRHARSTGQTKVWYFTTDLRVGADLRLIDEHRAPLSREHLTDAIGADRLTDSPAEHRQRVAAGVFGLHGDAGEDRYDALRQLLHTLRAPDVGNRINERGLTRILSDVLPPLGDTQLAEAGAQLDALTEARAAQDRLERSSTELRQFLDTYRSYAAGRLVDAAEAAEGAAERQDAAGNAVQQAQQAARDADDRRAAAESERQVQTERLQTVEAQIEALLASPAYRDATQLADRGRALNDLAATAGREMQRAWDAQERAGRAGDSAAETADLRAAAERVARLLEHARDLTQGAGLQPALPGPPTLTISEQPPLRLELPRQLEDPPVSYLLPVPARCELAVDDNAAQAVRQQKEALDRRAGLAEARARDAARLEARHEKVTAAEHAAGTVEEKARRAREEAEQAAAATARRAEELAAAWQEWITDPEGRRLLERSEEAPLPERLRAALQNGPDLDGWDAEALRDLDRSADAVAAPARSGIAARLARLADDRRRDEEQRADLQREAAALEAAVDPDPAAPSWVRGGRGGVPLWRAIDFACDLGEQERAGVEAALEASGLLTAILVAGDGVRAADGELLVSATGPAAGHPATAVLRPAAGEEATAATAAAVLERIALHPAGGPLWVGTDGSWGSGPLTGRHRIGAARHIGAAARAAARQRRLAEIEDQLGVLDTADLQRRRTEAGLAERAEHIDGHVRRAPASGTLLQARAAADVAAKEADRRASEAAQQRREATSLRDQWAADQRLHAGVCAEHGLPSSAGELRDAAGTTRGASTECRRVADALEALAASRARFGRWRAGQDDTLDRARTDHQGAQDAAAAHRAAKTAYVELRAAIGEDAEAVTARERELRREKRETEVARDSAQSGVEDAVRAAATAQAGTARCDADLQAARQRSDAARQRLRALLDAPGLLAAATADHESVQRDTRDASAGQTARAVLRSVRRPTSPVQTGTLHRLVADLRSALDQFDVHPVDTAEDLLLVDVAGSFGRRPLAEAVGLVERNAREGRDALSQREHQVFHDFILGQVAEELRRRIGQAQALVDSMNQALGPIRTSHGIGMKLRWTMRDPCGREARIKQLVATAAPIRGRGDTGELIDLLRETVAEHRAANPTEGYAAHLAAALDYRAWHTMDAVAVGPEPGRERRISGRLQVSEGETRFISYIILFAAVDAYLSALDEGAGPLRLLVLDDAFAKVDERTIAELMGLLVRLDIDFVMTGHALWGCYEQVPSVDVYEVRRLSDQRSPAITTHVHWDGRTRHLRAT